jgi:hypothetical protein
VGALSLARRLHGTLAEDALENGVDGAELTLEIEGAGERRGVKKFGDARVGGDAIAKTRFGFPRSHGVLLNQFVSVIAGRAGFDQVLQELAGENQAVRGFDVAQHSRGKNAHAGDDFGEAREHVVDEDRGVGQDDALDGAVRDVTLMPECNVFKRGNGVRAYYARQTGYLLATYRIAFVRHRGTAALFAGEGLFGFADFGALQMANLERELFECGGDFGEHAHVVSVAITRDHLRTDRSGIETEARANRGFNFGTEMRRVADGAGHFSDSEIAGGVAESREVAAIGVKPIREFQAESNGLGVNAVSAADLRRVLKFARASFENFAKTHKIVLHLARGFANQKRLRSIHNIVGSEAVMQPARGGGIADGFTDGHRECDDVMPHAGFEFGDARDDCGIHASTLTNRIGRGTRHNAALGERFGGGEFDFEPVPELAFFAPDAAHLFARVSRDQFGLLRVQPARSGRNIDKRRGNSLSYDTR